MLQRNPRAEWLYTLRGLAELVRLNAPANILAHNLMRVLLPRAARLIGVKEVAAEFAGFMADVMAAQTGLCCVCKRVDIADQETGMCPKCSAEMDQEMAEAETWRVEELEESGWVQCPVCLGRGTVRVRFQDAHGNTDTDLCKNCNPDERLRVIGVPSETSGWVRG